MLRLAAGTAAISVGAISGFTSHPVITITSVVGAGLVCSVLDRILPGDQLQVLHISDEQR